MNFRVAVLLLLLALLPFSATAGERTVLRGKAVLDNEGVSGVTVLAYRDYDRGAAGEVFARTGPTGADGMFSLPLPPGSWFLVGYRAEGGPSALKPGDLFCFFGGNPVRVEDGRAPLVGLNLSRIVPDPPAAGPDGLSGIVVDENGKPLDGATVYLYKSAADGFKGMPGIFARTKEDGTFRLRVRKGTFFAIARKRRSGDLFGPTLPGDYFGFYPGNPVTLADGAPKGLRVDAMPRLSQQEKMGESTAAPATIGIRARMVDGGGNPVAGVRLLAYKNPAMSGFPAYVSGKSGKDGQVELAVADPGRYHLLARERLGGPADGEWYGRYGGTPDHSAEAKAGETGEPLVVVVEKR
ncbi:MAG TPA: hypothetical protein VIU29_00020 [Candidatus Deferrimicrobiaceae bacterium]